MVGGILRVPDAETISLLSTALPRIGVGEHTIKVCVYRQQVLYRVDASTLSSITVRFPMGFVGFPKTKYGLYLLP